MAKIRTNGERDDNGERVQQVHYGPIEKFLAALQPVSTAVLIAGALGGVSMYARQERMEERQIVQAERFDKFEKKLEDIESDVEDAKDAAERANENVTHHDTWARKRSAAVDAVQKQVDEMEDRMRKQRNQ